MKNLQLQSRAFTLLWPTVILVSALAAGAVNVLFIESALRPLIMFWFALVCPGMVVVRFLRLNEPIAEWTLAVALSCALDTLIVVIQLYIGGWSVERTLTLLISFSICGAITHLVLNSKGLTR